MIPKDVNMMVSFINTRLRDDDMKLNDLLAVIEFNENELKEKLETAGFYYDDVTNQIKQK